MNKKNAYRHFCLLLEEKKPTTREKKKRRKKTWILFSFILCCLKSFHSNAFVLTRFCSVSVRMCVHACVVYFLQSIKCMQNNKQKKKETKIIVTIRRLTIRTGLCIHFEIRIQKKKKKFVKANTIPSVQYKILHLFY